MAENNVQIKITADDLASAILEGIKASLDSLNVSIGDVPTATKKATASINELNTEIKSTAETSNKTKSLLETIWDSIIKAWTHTKQDIGAELDSTLQQAVNSVQTTVGASMAGLTAFIQTSAAQWLVSLTPFEGVIASALTGASLLYAAYKSIDSLIDMLTGKFYESANIDTTSKFNKSIKDLEESLAITSKEAAAMIATMDRLGLSTAEVVKVYDNVDTAVAKNSEEFKRLGVAYQNTNGDVLETQVILKNAKTVLDEYTEGVDRNSAAQALGLGTYEQIVNALKITGKEMEISKEKLNALYLEFSPEKRKYIEDYQIAMREFGAEQRLMGLGIASVISDQIMPAYTTLSTWFKDNYSGMIEALRVFLASVTSMGYGVKTVLDILVDRWQGLMKTIEITVSTMSNIGYALANGFNLSEAKAALETGLSGITATIQKTGNQIVTDAENNLAAMQLAQGKFSQDTKAVDEDILEGKSYVSKESLKLQLNYYKAVGDMVAAETTQRTIAKNEAIATVTAKYERLAKLYEDDEDKIKEIETRKKAALLEINKKFDAEAEASYLKTQAAYQKATGDSVGAQLTQLKISKDAEIAIVNEKFAKMEELYQGNKAVLAGITVMKNSALLEIDKKHSADDQIALIDNQEKQLKYLQGSHDLQIAEIKKKVAAHELTEQQGASAILVIDNDLLAKQIDLAKQRVAALKSTGNSDDYKLAVSDLAKLEAQFTTKLADELKTRDAAKKQSLSDQLEAYKSALAAQDTILSQEVEKGLKTEEQAQIESLKNLQRNLDLQIAARQAAYNQMPDNDKNKAKELSAITALEKEYADKTIALKTAQYKQITSFIDQQEAKQTSAANHEIAQIELASSKGLISKDDAAKKINAIEEMVLQNKISSLTQQLAAAIKNYGAESAEAQKLAAAKIAAEDQLAATQEQHRQELLQKEKQAADAEKAIREKQSADNAAFWDSFLNTKLDMLSSLSSASVDKFKATMGIVSNSVKGVVENLSQARDAADEAYSALGKISGGTASWNTFEGVINSIATKAQLIAIEFNNQRVKAFEWMEALKNPSKSLIDTISVSLDNLKLLDKTTLDKLKGQIESVKQAMLSFTGQVVSALKSLQDEWDNMTMSKVQLENKRFYQEKTKLEQDYQTAVKQGNDDAIRALNEAKNLSDKIHAKKLADLTAEQAATDKLTTAYNKTGSARQEVTGYATGGLVPGSGSGDTVPAMLTPGEYVLTKSTVSSLGLGTVENLNRTGKTGKVKNGVQHFADGGEVKSVTTLNSATIQSSVLNAISSLEKQIDLATQLGTALKVPANETAEFVKQSEIALSKMTLLDQSTLDNLNNQIADVKNSMAKFAEDAQAHAKSLQDRWDDMTMSDIDKETKSYNEALLQWQAEYDEAKRQGNDEAVASMMTIKELTDLIHEKRMNDIEYERDAQKRADDEAIAAMRARADSAAASLQASEEAAIAVETAQANFYESKQRLEEMRLKINGSSLRKLQIEQNEIDNTLMRLSNPSNGYDFSREGQLRRDELLQKSQALQQQIDNEKQSETYKSLDSEYKAAQAKVNEQAIKLQQTQYLASLQNSVDEVTLSDDAKKYQEMITKLKAEDLRWNNDKLNLQNSLNAATKTGAEEQIAFLTKQIELNEKLHKGNELKFAQSAGFDLPAQYKASGGYISGSGDKDTVPAMLTPGEFVVRKSAVKHWGSGILEAINNPLSAAGNAIKSMFGGVQFFATGGAVGRGKRTINPMFLNNPDILSRVNFDNELDDLFFGNVKTREDIIPYSRGNLAISNKVFQQLYDIKTAKDQQSKLKEVIDKTNQELLSLLFDVKLELKSQNYPEPRNINLSGDESEETRKKWGWKSLLDEILIYRMTMNLFNGEKNLNAKAGLLPIYTRIEDVVSRIPNADYLDPFKKFATGGNVPGSGDGDTVPAMLTPGEFVVKKSAVQHWGSDILEAINNPLSKAGNAIKSMFGGVQFFANGGQVKPIPNDEAKTRFPELFKMLTIAFQKPFKGFANVPHFRKRADLIANDIAKESRSINKNKNPADELQNRFDADSAHIDNYIAGAEREIVTMGVIPPQEWKNPTSTLDLYEKAGVFEFFDTLEAHKIKYNFITGNGNLFDNDVLGEFSSRLKTIERLTLKPLEHPDPDDLVNHFEGFEFATGGTVPGSGDGDTVPAMLTPGEFVVKKSAVQHWGSDILEAINNPLSNAGNAIKSMFGGIQFFADGGIVKPLKQGDDETDNSYERRLRQEIREYNVNDMELPEFFMQSPDETHEMYLQRLQNRIVGNRYYQDNERLGGLLNKIRSVGQNEGDLKVVDVVGKELEGIEERHLRDTPYVRLYVDRVLLQQVNCEFNALKARTDAIENTKQKEEADRQKKEELTLLSIKQLNKTISSKIASITDALNAPNGLIKKTTNSPVERIIDTSSAVKEIINTFSSIDTNNPVALESAINENNKRASEAISSALADLATKNQIYPRRTLPSSLSAHVFTNQELAEWGENELHDDMILYRIKALLFNGEPDLQKSNYFDFLPDLQKISSGIKQSFAAKFATGGTVPGSGDGDTVPAMLTPGEFVVKKSAVQHWGAGLLEKINNIRSDFQFPMPQIPQQRLAFADGGIVPGNSYSGNGIGGAVNNIYLNITGAIDENMVRKQIIPVLERYGNLKG